jgi:4'-phosphopantetheinyl transferase
MNTASLTWEPGSTAPDLPPDEVHVWRIALDRPTDDLHRLAELLTEDERARAARFHFEAHRRRFLVARAGLRTVLGCYLRRPAAHVRFRYGTHGKPALAEEGCDLRFNLSHSAEGALLGLTRRWDIGVDLEQVRAMSDLEGLARRFFAPGEVADLLAVSAPERGRAFFRCWTRKEAYIKAVGLGLACPLECFRVSLDPGEGARLLEIDGSTVAAARWALCEVRPWPGYVGCVALPEHGCRRRCFDLVV